MIHLRTEVRTCYLTRSRVNALEDFATGVGRCAGNTLINALSTIGISMKITLGLLALAISAITADVFANTAEIEADAVELAETGAKVLRAQGKTAVIERLAAGDPVFLRDGLSLSIRDLKTGVIMGDRNPKIIGKDLTDVADACGKLYRREILALASTKGAGWVQYAAYSPVIKKVELRGMYLLRVDDVVLEAHFAKESPNRDKVCG